MHKEKISHESVERKKSMNFILLVLGRMTSNFSSTLLNFALGLYVLNITGNAGAFSFILSLNIICIILVNTFMGVFVDNHNKKKIVVRSDILSGIILLLFLCVFNVFPKSYLLIVINTVLVGFIQAVFNLAINSSIPNIVEEDKIAKTNAIMQAINAGANILSPIIGAILYNAWGIKLIFFINGAALIVSGITESFIKFKSDKKEVNTSEKRGYLDDFKVTFRYLETQPILIFFFIFAAVISLMYMPLVYMVLTYINYNILNVSELQLSFIQSSIAVGTIIGGGVLILKNSISDFMIKRFPILFKIQAILFICWTFPVMSSIFGEGKWGITIGFSIIILLTNMVNMFQNIPLISYFQGKIPEDIRGRVFGTFTSAIYMFSPLGMWIYGFLLDKIPWYYLTIASGVFMMIFGIYSSKNKYYKSFVEGLEVGELKNE